MSKRGNGGSSSDNEPTADHEGQMKQVAQRHYEPNGTGEITTTIIYAIAEAKGVSLTEVKSPPLYECIDASALENTFFGPNGADEPRRGIGTVKFQYTDYLVKVRSDGWIQVYEETGTDL